MRTSPIDRAELELLRVIRGLAAPVAAGEPAGSSLTLALGEYHHRFERRDRSPGLWQDIGRVELVQVETDELILLGSIRRYALCATMSVDRDNLRHRAELRRLLDALHELERDQENRAAV